MKSMKGMLTGRAGVDPGTLDRSGCGRAGDVTLWRTIASPPVATDLKGSMDDGPSPSARELT